MGFRGAVMFESRGLVGQRSLLVRYSRDGASNPSTLRGVRRYVRGYWRAPGCACDQHKTSHRCTKYTVRRTSKDQSDRLIPCVRREGKLLRRTRSYATNRHESDPRNQPRAAHARDEMNRLPNTARSIGSPSNRSAKALVRVRTR